MACDCRTCGILLTAKPEFPLTSAEEKHMDTYMVMSTTKNKTRTKYSKEVSEK